VLQALQGEADAGGEVVWTVVSIDGTTVRAPQHAAGARHTPAPAEPPAAAEKGEVTPADEALGRSRGGFTTKLHLAAEGHGRPLTVRLTAGQRHESTQLEPVLDGIRVPRPRKRPDQVALDQGHSYPKCRKVLRGRGIRHVIPERKDQREQRRAKGCQGGRPPRFDREVYRQRSWAERCVNRCSTVNWAGTCTVGISCFVPGALILA
jgi:transposase